MTFNYELVKKKAPLPRLDVAGVRHYKLPDGTLVPSVTTVLSKRSKAGIDRWKEKVGYEQAAAISKAAGVRGTAVHDLCEGFLRAEKDFMSGAMPSHKATFLTIKPLLVNHVTTIYGIELPLYSYKYKTAGTSDLICLWDNIPSIVDFKTSKRLKEERFIDNYQMQATIYGVMAKELYETLDIAQIVIIIAVDGELNPQLFKYSLDKYTDKTTQFFMEYSR